MLGVLILGLGLLGLAAVMPAVIAQQRNAANTSLGVSAAQSVKVYLAGRPDFNRIGTQANPRGIGVWYFNELWSKTNQWAAPKEIDPATGEFELGTGPDRVVIPIGERLWPSPGSGRGSPSFVWDILARSVAPNAAGTVDVALRPEIEIVVFVRRVDAGIRPSGGKTIWELLLEPNPKVLPVADDADSGIPTANGVGVYSLPRRMSVDFEVGPNGERDRIVMLGESVDGPVLAGGVTAEVGDSETLKSLAARPGQKIVDNLGNIYTVVRADPDFEDRLIITPPVPAWVGETNDGNVDDSREFRQFAFTLQIPADVMVFRLPAVNPKE
jgi:hypothetical protein